VATVAVATVAVATVLVFWSYVVGRLGAAISPKELLELGHPNALTVFAGDVQTILVDQHLRMLEPLPPGGLGHGVEDFLPELTFEWRLIEAFGHLTELDALNGSRHGPTILPRARRPSTRKRALRVGLLDRERERHAPAIETAANLALPASAGREHETDHRRHR